MLAFMQALKRVYDPLSDYLEPGKVLVLYGPRRVGKTTLIHQFLKQTTWVTKLDTGDNIHVQNLLSSQDPPKILAYLEGVQLYVIDEAQEIAGVGQGLKIIVDHRPDIVVIATGSSSFSLAGSIGEPLTGRKRTLTLYPLSQGELGLNLRSYDLAQNLENYLIFGSYPETLTRETRHQKIQYLLELVDSYLLKDILSLERVKGSKVFLDLLKMLAFQIGQMVSMNELSNALNIDVKTVARYIDLLEKTFVIKRLNGFSRNLRKEITQKSKFYFLDLGIRNAIISQFNALDSRADIGQLWENFLVIERIKKCHYEQKYGSHYFWRTHTHQEIDFIETFDNTLNGYEFKWNDKKQPKVPSEWKAAYPEATFTGISQKNYLEFVGKS